MANIPVPREPSTNEIKFSIPSDNKLISKVESYIRSYSLEADVHCGPSDYYHEDMIKSYLKKNEIEDEVKLICKSYYYLCGLTESNILVIISLQDPIKRFHMQLDNMEAEAMMCTTSHVYILTSYCERLVTVGIQSKTFSDIDVSEYKIKAWMVNTHGYLLVIGSKGLYYVSPLEYVSEPLNLDEVLEEHSYCLDFDTISSLMAISEKVAERKIFNLVLPRVIDCDGFVRLVPLRTEDYVR